MKYHNLDTVVTVLIKDNTHSHSCSLTPTHAFTCTHIQGLKCFPLQFNMTLQF